MRYNADVNVYDAIHQHLREKGNQIVRLYTQNEIAEKTFPRPEKRQKKDFVGSFFLSLQIELIEMKIRKWAWEMYGNGTICAKVSYASQ